MIVYFLAAGFFAFLAAGFLTAFFGVLTFLGLAAFLAAGLAAFLGLLAFLGLAAFLAAGFFAFLGVLAFLGLAAFFAATFLGALGFSPRRKLPEAPLPATDKRRVHKKASTEKMYLFLSSLTVKKFTANISPYKGVPHWWIYSKLYYI